MQRLGDGERKRGRDCQKVGFARLGCARWRVEAKSVNKEEKKKKKKKKNAARV